MQGVYYPIAQHLQQFCDKDQFVIWRDSFRWKKHIPNEIYSTDDHRRDEVLSNHYDGMSLEHLADDFGYEIEWSLSFNHVAIVRKINP